LSPRASWKGFLKVAEVTAPVGLYSAASSAGQIVLHTVNRATGHRVQRQYVDAETGAATPTEDQVKGYEAAKDEYVMIEPDEVAALSPHGEKTIDVSAFIDRDEVDELYFDQPYYLSPSEPGADDILALLNAGLRKANVVAIARAGLFRRERTLLIRPYDGGLVATTLKFDYQLRSAADVFDQIPATRISKEALDLAKHIIKTKRGAFDPSAVHDRYEAALAELVKAKIEGKPIRLARTRAPAARQNLLAALRESARALAKTAAPAAKAASPRRRPARVKAPPRRKAG
jgi:DNA end-binding protein Ku